MNRYLIDEKVDRIDIYSKQNRKWVIDEEEYNRLRKELSAIGSAVYQVTIDESVYRSPIYTDYLLKKHKNIVCIIPANTGLGFGQVRIQKLGVDVALNCKSTIETFEVLKHERDIRLTYLDNYLRIHTDQITHLIMSTETIADIASQSGYRFYEGLSSYIGIPIAVCDAEKPGIVIPVWK